LIRSKATPHGASQQESSAKIVIYTSAMCGFCVRAIRLLDSKKVDYQQIDVTMSPDLRAEMRMRAGGRHTVPQIFVNDRHVGDCDEIYALESAGRLDTILRP
jgi:glutaredoxin 3